jgi:hypothetical protein
MQIYLNFIKIIFIYLYAAELLYNIKIYILVHKNIL